jgi:hydroxyacylglutathione hydrolase
MYPGHGSGSACGKSIGSGDFCEVGTQKKNNYGLKATDKKSFVEQVLNEMPSPPSYFAYNARLNKFDKFDYEEAFKKSNTKLPIDEVYKLQQSGVKIIDVRGVNELQSGIIKGALCIDFNGGFATWVGTLIDPKE